MKLNDDANRSVVFRLKSLQAEFFFSENFLPPKLRCSIQNVTTTDTGGSSFTVERGQIEFFREFFFDQLAMKGYDENYELNDVGRILEELSDIFFRLRQHDLLPKESPATG